MSHLGISNKAFERGRRLWPIVLTLPPGGYKYRDYVSGTGKGGKCVSGLERGENLRIYHRYDDERNETDSLWKRDVLEPEEFPKRYFGHRGELSFEKKKASASIQCQIYNIGEKFQRKVTNRGGGHI
ncbi:MAG: hypothetical protein SA339_13115 [Methanomassiliicoccus sp.]|nr:hypothetical protein [Methanomassiliicoccus sp.]